LFVHELKARKGIDWSGKTLRAKIRRGLFPAPINLGNVSIGWVEAELDDWLNACISERDNPSPEKLAAREAFSARARRGSVAGLAAKRRRKAEAAELQRMAANKHLGSKALGKPRPKRAAETATATASEA
jgi:hypothetical protein